MRTPYWALLLALCACGTPPRTTREAAPVGEVLLEHFRIVEAAPADDAADDANEDPGAAAANALAAAAVWPRTMVPASKSSGAAAGPSAATATTTASASTSASTSATTTTSASTSATATTTTGAPAPQRATPGPAASDSGPPVPVRGAWPNPAAPAADAPPPLELEDVLLSVERQFPLVLAALEQREIAGGNLLASEGAFDTRLAAGTEQELDGFYDGDEYELKIEQPTTLWGLSVDGGWRRGEGSFAVYDGKDKTNTGGEFKLGARLPLLQGGRTDQARTAMAQAAVERDRADPVILRKRLEATRKAAEAYWKWVAAGGKRAIAERLLELAETRQGQIAASVEAGELAPIDLVDNRRLIVDRTAKQAAAERGLQQAAIVLSLYWRDAQGRPLVPEDGRLPPVFPAPRSLEQTLVPDDEAVAVERRPELRDLELRREALELEAELLDNQLLPRLDLGVQASRDQGDAVNTPDDKGDLEVEASLRFQLPLQRRKPRGKARANDARLTRLGFELAYLRDVVVSEVRDARSALRQSWLRLDQARQNVELAQQMEQAERLQLDLGESDLFRVNVREKQSAEAAAGLVDVLAEHFRALAGYRAVLGIPYDEVLAGRPVGGG